MGQLYVLVVGDAAELVDADGHWSHRALVVQRVLGRTLYLPRLTSLLALDPVDRQVLTPLSVVLGHRSREAIRAIGLFPAEATAGCALLFLLDQWAALTDEIYLTELDGVAQELRLRFAPQLYLLFLLFSHP